MYFSVPYRAKCAQNRLNDILIPGMLVPTCSISRQIWTCAVLEITVHIPECSSSTLKVHICSHLCTIHSHIQQWPAHNACAGPGVPAPTYTILCLLWRCAIPPCNLILTLLNHHMAWLAPFQSVRMHHLGGVVALSNVIYYKFTWNIKQRVCSYMKHSHFHFISKVNY